MRGKGLKRGLLLSTSVMTAVLGYSRRAYATCTALPGPSNAYICTGAPGVPTAYSFYGSDISVLVASPTVFYNDTTYPASDQISISGDGNLVFESQDSVYLFSEYEFGVRIEHTVGSLTDPGNIDITTSYEPPTSFIEWGIEGYEGGIGAFHNGEGNILMDLSSRVEGYESGVTAVHDGEGDISISIGSPTVGVPDGTIAATGSGPTYHAIDADHNGTGNISITVNGDVTAAGGNGVNATTAATGTGITVNLGDGNIEGNVTGINVDHTGTTGGVSILATSLTATGTVTGTGDSGIDVQNSGAAGVTITTGAGDINGYGDDGINVYDGGTGGVAITVNGSDVYGALTGIDVFNAGGGSITIITNAGTVTGEYYSGIAARNYGGTGAVSITTGGGAITGDAEAIYASNSGDGGIEIDTGAGVVSGTNEGIDARNYGEGLLDIATGSGAVTGNDGYGIVALNTDGDSVGVLINTGSGAITGNGGYDAIRVNNYGGYVTIATGSGRIEGDDEGIHVYHFGTGLVSISTTGEVEGVGGNGIEVYNDVGSGVDITIGAGDVTGNGVTDNGIYVDNETGYVTIETTTGNVTGYDDGIDIDNAGAGGVTVTTAGSLIEGENGNGIDISDTGAGGITVTTGAGDEVSTGVFEAVRGAANGITTSNTGGGGTSITLGSGDVIGVGSVGVYASDIGDGGVTIESGSGDVYGGTIGIGSYNSGAVGALSITTLGGDVVGQLADGIFAFNTSGDGLSITTGDGDVTGGNETGNQVFAAGIDALDNGTGGIAIITGDGAVTGDVAGIRAANEGGGNVTVDTYDGAILGVFGIGISVTNTGGTGLVDVATGIGTVTGNTSDGIFASNTGDGGITVNTGEGDITGGAAAGANAGADGIDVYNSGAGNTTVTVNDSNVTGDDDGLRVRNYGAGDIAITTNNGDIEGVALSGIRLINQTGSGAAEITTNDGTVTGGQYGINAVNNGSGLLEITIGDGDITGTTVDGIRGGSGSASLGAVLTLTGSADVTGGDDGIVFGTAGGYALIDASASTGLIEGQGDFGIESEVTASATGGLTILTGAGNSDGEAVLGATTGIYARHRGGGLLEITTGSGSVTGTSVTGIFASNQNGTGVDIETGSGLVEGGGAAGIDVRNESGYVTITTADGDVLGEQDGITVLNSGAGDVTITTADASVIGTTNNGIDVSDTSTGDVIITTGDGDGDGLAVQGAVDGIQVDNTGGGYIDITIGDGDIFGTTGDGINADNATNSTSLTIRLDGSADVTGGDDGIDAEHGGTDDLTIDVADATGVVEGETGDGIRALSLEDALGDISITTGAGDGTDAVIGQVTGIDVDHNGYGSVTITTGTGRITGTTTDGITADVGYNGENLGVTTGTGRVQGGQDGIDVNNKGDGYTTVVTYGEVRGLGDHGIQADSGGYNSISGTVTGTGLAITTNAYVYGGGPSGDGINANNDGAGNLTITTNAAVRGEEGDGIEAENGYQYYDTVYGANLIITTEALVSGGTDGINATNTGYGYTQIITNGAVTGEDGDGIYARNGVGFYLDAFGTDLRIYTYAEVRGEDGSGIDAANYGTGSLIITTDAYVYGGNSGDGIRARNGGYYYDEVFGSDLTITANAAVYGNEDGIDATSRGDGTLTITAEEDVTGENGDGIRAQAGLNQNQVYGDGIDISTYGTVTGGDGDGIDADNIGQGNVTIYADGAVYGEYGDGIKVSNGSYYDGSIYGANVVITTNDVVTGAQNGIWSTNTGYGYTLITTNAAVTGEDGDGIYAANGVIYSSGSAYGTNLQIYANDTVEGSDEGIEALNLGTGSITIITQETVTGTGGSGIQAVNGSYSDQGLSDSIAITSYDAVEGDDYGIIATNFGSGGVTVSVYDDVTGGTRDGIYARNYGDDGISITTRSGAINGAFDTGLGADAGIDAEDYGAGGITITTGSGDVRGANFGIAAENYGGGLIDIETAAGDILGRNGYGIRAVNDTYGTAIEITTGSGSITGVTDSGIAAFNDGSGGITIFTSTGAVTGGSGVPVTLANGITADDDGAGSININTGTGAVLGDQSGISANNTGGGGISVTVNGDVTGTAENGIETVQTGAGVGTLITVNAGVTVQGGLAGINMTSDGLGLGIINNGTIQTLSELDTALAVRGTGGITTITNNGVMTGRVELSAFSDTVENSGTWNTGGISLFGAATDSVRNYGVVIAANSAGVVEVTQFQDLDGFQNGSALATGTIDLSDDATGGGSTSFDSLEITGSFDGIAGVLQLDAFLGGAGSQADVLIIGGTATGLTSILVNNTNALPGGIGANILVVDTNGATGTEFVLSDGPIVVGAYVYDLFFENNDFFLRSALDTLRLDAATLPAIMGDLWEITATGWHRNTLQLQRSAAGGAAVTGSTNGASPTMGGAYSVGWGTVIVDSRSTEGTIIADTGGVPTPIGVGFDQTTLGFVGGVDFVLAPDANGGRLTFGALLGVVDSTVDFEVTGNTAELSGPTYGFHVAYATDALRADLMVKRDDLDLEYNVFGLGEEPGEADAVSTGVSLEFGYKVSQTERMTVEAVGNLSHVATEIDSFTVGASTFDFGNSSTTRGALGVTFRGSYAMGAMNMTPSATIKYWNVFDGGYSSAIDATGFSYDHTGGYVEASAMVEFVNPGTGWSGFVSGSGFIGEDRNGVRGQVGLNLEW